MALNNTVNRTTGFAPNHIVFGVLPTMPRHLASRIAREQAERDLLTVEWLRGFDEFNDGLNDKRQHKMRQEAVDRMLGVKAELFDKVLQRAEILHLRKGAQEEKEGNRLQADAEKNRTRPIKKVEWQPGQYVYKLEPIKLTTDNLPFKLQPNRWSGPWRIVAIVRSVAAILSRAPNFTEATTTSVTRLRSAALDKEQKRIYDEYWRQMDETKKGVIDNIRRARAEVADWCESSDYPKYVFKRILAVTGKGKHRKVRVEWADGTRTDEDFAQFKQDAPEELERFLNAQNRDGRR